MPRKRAERYSAGRQLKMMWLVLIPLLQVRLAMALVIHACRTFQTILVRDVLTRLVPVQAVLVRAIPAQIIPTNIIPTRTISSISIVLICVTIGTISQAIAQDDGILFGTKLPGMIPYDAAPDTIGDDPFLLYIPDKMLAGVTYHGMILFTKPQDHDASISLVTLYGTVQIPDSVLIPKGKNHGIFEIMPMQYDQGVTLYAVSDMHAASASSVLYPGHGHATDILIMSPGYPGTLKTSADNIPLHILLVDGHGRPAYAKQDTAIHMSSDSSISFSKTGLYRNELTHIIRAGEYSGTVHARVPESGTIHASSGAMHGSLDVEYKKPQIEVKFAIAPDIAKPNSVAYYYIWLERDGMPYAPAEPINAYLTIQDGQVARFPQAFAGDEPYHDYIINGIARGTMNAGSPAFGSSTTVTASVPGIGSASAVLAVGYHASGDGLLYRDVGSPASDDAHFACVKPYCQYSNDVKAALNEPHLLADSALLWVYPGSASGQAWGVLGAYRTIYAQDAILRTDLESAGGIEVFKGDKVMIPAVFGPDAHAVISSDSASTKHTVQLRAPGAASGSAIEFPLNVRGSGSFTVSAYGTNFEGISREFAVQDSYASTLSTRVTKAAQKDTALISIVDDNGYVIDASRVLGDIAPHSSSAIDWKPGHSVGVMRNITVEAFVHLSGVQSALIQIPDHEALLGVDLWMPDIVHSHEEFPVALHAVNLDGEPLYRLDEFESMGLPVQNGRAIAYGDSIINILAASDGLFDESKLRSFENDISQEIAVSADTQVRLGNDLILKVSTGAVPRPAVTIQSSLNFEPDSLGRHVAGTMVPGLYDVALEVAADGWNTYRQNITFDVREYADISHVAFAGDGTPIPVPMRLDAIDGPASFTILDTMPVPYGVFEASVPADIVLGAGRYEHVATTSNGKAEPGTEFLAEIKTHTALESAYRRVVDVTMEHLYESEFKDRASMRYGYGDTVTLNAPWKYESYGLVWRVPVQWSGVNPEYISADLGSATFDALQDHHVVVRYEENYAVLIAAAASASTVTVATAWRKFADIVDAISAVLPKVRRIRR